MGSVPEIQGVLIDNAQQPRAGGLLGKMSELSPAVFTFCLQRLKQRKRQVNGQTGRAVAGRAAPVYVSLLLAAPLICPELIIPPPHTHTP